MNIIVIPVYKDVLDANEYKSLFQCLKVLYKHPICLIGPEDLNYSVYNEVFSEYGVKFDIETFDSNYFKSVAGYNKLMLSRFFYERFSSYKYMLIYQLDAYVFKDELDYWCDKDYDYIGAPWMKLSGELDEKNSGNGGFSLRKIESFISLFDHKGLLLSLKGLCCFYRYRGPLHKPICVLAGLLGRRNHLEDFTETNIVNEDLLYAVLKYKRGQKFRIPESAESMYFSFEESPSMLFELTGHTLPFGCHAWYKYDYVQFWSKYIY
ncbi:MULTISPECIES: DUF5672 family protein [Parabacteroides]|uniref:DUF5672 family protein n=1 Tax=Parabacteroides timonensis TaxID=1871013 RepID=UPI00094F2320|nr:MULTISPECIES: DUF5672 family protein [Parabacteroides]